MTTAGDAARYEALALRMVLASLRADRDTADAMHLWEVLRAEIKERDCWEHVSAVLAAMLAEDMAIEHGPKKAARELEKLIAARLDFADRDAERGQADDQ
jgi:hypothetical protein